MSSHKIHSPSLLREGLSRNIWHVDPWTSRPLSVFLGLTNCFLVMVSHNPRNRRDAVWGSVMWKIRYAFVISCSLTETQSLWGDDVQGCRGSDLSFRPQIELIGEYIYIYNGPAHWLCFSLHLVRGTFQLLHVACRRHHIYQGSVQYPVLCWRFLTLWQVNRCAGHEIDVVLSLLGKLK